MSEPEPVGSGVILSGVGSSECVPRRECVALYCNLYFERVCTTTARREICATQRPVWVVD